MGNPPTEFALERIYVRDLSFESPRAPDSFREPWKPQLQLDLNTRTNGLGEERFEVILTVTVHAKSAAGQTIMIDMNRYFPFFRSRVREGFAKRGAETYIPSLKEYTRPFRDTGFEIKESRNFCWIPHSANQNLLKICRALTPVLETCCSPLAMRSLVVGRRPV